MIKRISALVAALLASTPLALAQTVISPPVPILSANCCGTIILTSNNNNQIVWPSGTGIGLSTTGSVQFGTDVNGPVVGNDTTANTLVIDAAPADQNTDVNLSVYPSLYGGAFINVASDAAPGRQQRLILGAPSGKTATRYVVGQVTAGTGTCLPVDFLNASNQVGFTLTCDPHFRLPNATGLYARNVANNADLQLIVADSANALEIGNGASSIILEKATALKSTLNILNNTNINGQNAANNAALSLMFIDWSDRLQIGYGTAQTLIEANGGTVCVNAATCPGTLGVNGTIYGNSHISTAAAATVSASHISYGGTTVAAGSATCPTGTIGGQTVQGCAVINVAGTTRYLPFF